MVGMGADFQKVLGDVADMFRRHTVVLDGHFDCVTSKGEEDFRIDRIAWRHLRLARVPDLLRDCLEAGKHANAPPRGLVILRDPEGDEVLQLAHGDQRKAQALALIEQLASFGIGHCGARKLVEDLAHEGA